MLKAKDLRTEDVSELEAMLDDLHKELFALKSELKVNRKLEKPHLVKEKRHDIARILTVLTEKRKEGKDES